MFRVRLTTIILALTALAGCATTTELTAVWKEPGLQPVRFNKVIVAFQSPDGARRRQIEDLMVARIANATPSYTLITEDDAKNREQARQKVTAAGFDGAVVARFVSSENQQTYVPGSTWWGPAPYGSMWGYWGYGWGAAYSPGYVVNDQIVTLETNVYSVADDKLLWASRSETFNPSSSQDLVNSVIDATVSRMKKEGALP
jgi:hypothetical protein